MAQTHYTAFTVQSSQVPSTQTDFPVVIALTDARFKSTGNGGHVAGTSGFDLRPYSDSALTTALTYQLIVYSATAGTFEMKVKIALLSNGAIVYVGYGDAALNTDGSSTGTWDGDFIGAYAFGDGTTLSVADSTANGNNLTGINTPSAVAGLFGGAASLDAASDECFSFPNITAAFSSIASLSLLVKNVEHTPTDAAKTGLFGLNPSNADHHYPFTDGNIYDGTFKTGRSTVGTGSVSDRTQWHHVAITCFVNVNGWKFYQNGAVYLTNQAFGFDLSTTAYIGRTNSNSAITFNGSIDELRISKVIRSADWIATEYNNLVNWSSFFSTGTEVVVGGGVAALTMAVLN